MRDERFYAEMRKGRISLFKPTENADEWFNMLLIHQNRCVDQVCRLRQSAPTSTQCDPQSQVIGARRRLR
jgi:hypothetical protein